MELQTIKDNLYHKLAEFNVAKSQVVESRKAVIYNEVQLDNAEEAQGILQHTAQAIQQEVHSKIASIVSLCLESVFEDPYEFRIVFERKRGKTEAVFEFIRDGLILRDPKNEIGVGVVDVASFALRLACLMLMRPPLRRLLVLDEPFKNIRGKHNREKVRGLLLKLSEEMGIQFLLNIDIDAYPEFALGKIVEPQAS